MEIFMHANDLITTTAVDLKNSKIVDEDRKRLLIGWQAKLHGSSQSIPVMKGVTLDLSSLNWKTFSEVTHNMQSHTANEECHSVFQFPILEFYNLPYLLMMCGIHHHNICEKWYKINCSITIQIGLLYTKLDIEQLNGYKRVPAEYCRSTYSKGFIVTIKQILDNQTEALKRNIAIGNCVLP